MLYDTVQNRILIVEIKSGYGYRELYNGNMLHITPSVNNCAFHQHQLQTIIGTQLFKKTYTKCKLSIVPVLVYVTLQGDVRVVEESDFKITYSKAIEHIILRTVS